MGKEDPRHRIGGTSKQSCGTFNSEETLWRLKCGSNMMFGQDKQVILVIDRAGWHTSERVKLPDGLHLSFIPSHSPELQPAERLWTITNEPIANQCFKNLDEVEEILFQRCRQILDRPDFVRGLTKPKACPRCDRVLRCGVRLFTPVFP